MTYIKIALQMAVSRMPGRQKHSFSICERYPTSLYFFSGYQLGNS